MTSGKLGATALGLFKLGASPSDVEHVCFTYEGDDTPAFTYQGAAAFTYEGDDTPAFTYQGEC